MSVNPTDAQQAYVGILEIVLEHLKTREASRVFKYTVSASGGKAQGNMGNLPAVARKQTCRLNLKAMH
jgi:hypothetical protein